MTETRILKYLGYILLLCAACTLSSCGFHLRGLIHLPPNFNQVAIVNQNQHIHPDFIQSLTLALDEQHIHVVDDPNQAHYLIILEQNSLNQVLTNVAASTAPRQYQLSYSIQFQLTSIKGHLLLPDQTITIMREVTINNDRILGSTFESQTIEHEMHQHAASQLLARISARFRS